MNQLLNRRRAGVLLHISSLPGRSLGRDAWRFVDFLSDIGATVWQTLPLNMTHSDGSPYQSLSAHAGNPDFICMTSVMEDGWLTHEEISNASADRAELFAKAFSRLLDNRAGRKAFETFCNQTPWLEDFAFFLVLRHQNQQTCWNGWPDEYKNRDILKMDAFKQRYPKEIDTVKFTQYLFFKQWHALKNYANSKDIALFGDIPIFVSYDSSDVWSQPELFKLDADRHMTVVAGVPPDYFSATGQRWGNPHYNWHAMQTDGFAWWLARMKTQSALFDLVRIDHFRGLEAAWEIPSTEITAMNGAWQPAPGDALLQAITENFPRMTLVAEDLGIITDEVNALREKYALPGMKILQFAFDGSPDNPYLPAFITENSVVYTGTHDNDTSLGWYESLSEQQRAPLYAYIGAGSIEMPQALVNMALNSAAELAIIPMQDVLRLNSAHRMNVPGTIIGNWQWRFEWEQLSEAMKEYMTLAIRDSGRAEISS